MRAEFAHWNVLFKEFLKRDWKRILLRVIGLGGFAGGFVPAFVEVGKGSGLYGIYEMMKNPAMISLCGPTPVNEAADYTVGAMYSHTMLLFSALTAMIIAAVHVVSHTRKEEESGLTEYICAFRVGRHANSAALLAEELLVHGLLFLFAGGLMAAFRVQSVDVKGAFLFAAYVGTAGLMGAAMAFLAAQIMPSAAGATGVSLAMIGILYIVRAGTDISNVKLSMWNPMGWTYLGYPFTENHVRPLLYAGLFCIFVVTAAFLLERGRDMSAGYLPERAGRGTVRRSLLSVRGLLMRLNRGVIIGWIITLICLGATYGSIYGDMETFLNSNDLIRMMFFVDGISVETSFTATILVVLGGLSAILPAVIVNRLYAEETGGHLAVLSAGMVTRAGLYWRTVLIAVLSGTTGILAAAGSLGGSAMAVMDECSLEMKDFLAAGANYIPAVFFIAALAALVLGWSPRLGKVIYVYIGYSLMLNYFRGILELPGWFEKTAVLSWIPRMPMDEFDAAPFAVITLISVICMLIGYAGYRRRDLQERA